MWGKSKGLSRPYPLLAHMIDTAAVMYTYVSSHSSTNLRRQLGVAVQEDLCRLAFAAGLHDLGKATPVFQGQHEDSKLVLSGEGFGFPAGKSIRHERATQFCLPEALTADVGPGALGGPLEGRLGLGCMLGGHHGVFSTLDPDERHESKRPTMLRSQVTLGDDRWASEQARHLSMLRRAVGAEDIPDLADAQLVVAAGLVVLSDWLASQESFIGDPEGWPADWATVDWAARFRAKAEASHQVIRRAGLSAPAFVYPGFEQVFKFAPRDLQSSLDGHLSGFRSKPGLVLVAAPMGVGKTEAALAAARLLGGPDAGLFFALPTMATADAMFDRVVKHVVAISHGSQEIDVGLVHSMGTISEAFLMLPDRSQSAAEADDPFDAIGIPVSDDEETRVVAADWLRGRQRTLLATVAAGTIDQVLAAALRSKRGFLRYTGLVGKVVIIDEAHSLDWYMHGLLTVVLEWLGRLQVPVIVLSATLPQRVAQAMTAAWCAGANVAAPVDAMEYPGWLHVDAESGTSFSARVQSPRRELQITSLPVEGWGIDTCATAVRQTVAGIAVGGGCGLVVCNTVSDAQNLAEALAPWAAEHGVELTCLHSRFRQADRRAITKRVISGYGNDNPDRPARGLVIGTQVVEQSLDVDFDVVVSCLAPIAPLLQRAGRGHRHERLRPPNFRDPHLVVVAPFANGALALPMAWRFVYPAVYLQRTWDLSLDAGSKQRWLIPDDVQTLVDDVYATAADLEKTEIDPELLEQLDREWLSQFENGRSRIPTPSALAALHEMTGQQDEDLLLATRLGVDSVMACCCFDHGDVWTLDAAGTMPLPTTIRSASVREVIGATVPIRRSKFVTDVEAETGFRRPAVWKDSPWLKEVLLIPLNPTTATAELAGWSVVLDSLTGFHHRRNT